MPTKRLLPWQLKDALIASLVPFILQFGILLTVWIALRLYLIPTGIADFLQSKSNILGVVEYALALSIEVGVLIWLVVRRRAKPRDLGLIKFRWHWLAVVLGLYGLQILLIILVYALIQVLAPGVNLDEPQDVFAFGLSNWGIILSFVTTVLVAPLIEEIIFRGIIYPALASRWKTWVAAIISSLVFALMHGQLNVGIYTFVIGLLLCWLYQRSGSIVPGIILHFLNNIIAFWLIASTGAHLL